MAPNPAGVTATSDSGKPVEVTELEATAQPAGEVDPTNPFGEPTQRVRCKPGFSFLHEGVPRHPGDEFNMTLKQLRDGGAQFVDAIAEDGKVQPIMMRGAGAEHVTQTNLAGMARHERVEALEVELKALEERAERVKKQRDFEKAGLQAEIDKGRQPSSAQPGGAQGGLGAGATPSAGQESPAAPRGGKGASVGVSGASGPAVGSEGSSSGGSGASR